MKTAVAALSLLLIAGCGFHLRQSIDIPDAYQPLALHMEQQHSALAEALRHRLNISGVELADGKDSPYRLEVMNEQASDRTRSLDAFARVAEREFFHRADLSLVAADGSRLFGPVTLQTNQIVVNDPSDPVSEQSEADLVRSELTQDLARDIVWQLQRWAEQANKSPVGNPFGNPVGNPSGNPSGNP